MKRTLLLVVFALCIAPVYGQISITSQDFAKNGMSYPTATDTMGVEDTLWAEDLLEKPWDFTGLQAEVKDTAIFTNPEDTPYAEVFPEANMAGKGLLPGFAFLHKSAGELRLHGLISDTSMLDSSFVYQFEEPVLILPFPANMGDAYASEASGSITDTPEALGIPLDSFDIQPDSLRIKLSLNVQSEFDAHGTIQTPTGNVESLRQRNIQILTAEVYAYITSFLYTGWLEDPLFTEEDTTQTYNWYGKGLGIPFLSMTHDDGLVTSVQYQTEMPASVNANLAAIYIAGDSLRNFSPQQTDYAVEVAADQQEVPGVSAVPADTAASVEVYQAENLTGTEEERTTTIEVTAESGHRQSYHITFAYEVLSANSKLASITVGGDSLEGFTPDEYRYEYTVTATDSVPEVTAVVQDTAASLQIEPAETLSGDSAARTTTITVTAEDESQTVYAIEFVRAVGIAHQQREAAQVYPNPAGKQLTVEIPVQQGRILLRDLTGRILLEQQLRGSRTKLSLSGYKPGVYIYQIQSDANQRIEQGKLVIKE